MSRTTKFGLWLLPWLPLLIIAAALDAYGKPSKYLASGKFILHRHADGTTSTEILSSSPPFEFHLTWVSVLSWLCIAAFAAGIILLMISLFHRLSRRDTIAV